MSIESLALEVISLKKAASEALASGDIDAFMLASCTEIQKQKKLRLDVTTHPFIEVESKAAKDLLRKIRSEVSEEEQAMEEILKVIEDQGTCGLLVEDAGDIDELTNPLLYSWFSDREYVLGLFRSGAVVVRCGVPHQLKSLVEEARQCFAFQQYNAVFSLCRTIIEAAATDIGVRVGNIHPSDLARTDFYKQYPPWQRIDDVTPTPLQNDLHKFYTSASELIHGRKTVGQFDSLEALRYTLQTVEKLYSHNRDKLASSEPQVRTTPTPAATATGSTPA